MPVGNYYSGSGAGLNALVMQDFDRAATRGTGAVKVGGNYAADLLPNKLCKGAGYDTCLYVCPHSCAVCVVSVIVLLWDWSVSCLWYFFCSKIVSNYALMND